MPRIEMTQATNERNDWITKWESILISGTTPEDLAAQFIIRWERNAPSFAPARLRPPSTIDSEADWSIWLERFLLSKSQHATFCAALVVRSIQIATARWEADLGRIVWFRDVAALRRVAYADDQVRHLAASILLQTMHKLVGKSVEPELENYMHLEKLYSVASNCLVSELYEPEPSRHAYRAGLAGGRFEDFTVIWQLEKARLHFNESQKPESSESISREISSHWVDLAKLYQSTADDLFDTLLELTAQVEARNDLLSRAEKFKSFLERSFSRESKPINDYAKYLGYQRLLDLHWVRFSVLVSPRNKDLAFRIRRFIVFISEGQEAIREKINRSILVVGLREPLAPKYDPSEVLSLSNSRQESVEVKLNDIARLQLLTESNYELSDMLEDLSS